MSKLVPIHNQNASICLYWNGDYVKLKLRPGERIELNSWQYTDEGFDSTRIVFFYEYGEVWKNVFIDGRDCDGRMSSYICMRAEPAALCEHARAISSRAEGNHIESPWQHVDSSQRDWAAEAAGY